MWKQKGRVKKLKWSELKDGEYFSLFHPAMSNTIFQKLSNTTKRRIVTRTKWCSDIETWNFRPETFVWTFKRFEICGDTEVE